MDANDWKEKVFLITGASRGIGRAIAQSLAKKGAQLALCSRDLESLESLAEQLSERRDQIKCYQVDITKKEDLFLAVDQMIRFFGQIDGIVNNAGVMPLSFMKNVKVDEWDWMIDVNIKGVTHGIAACLPIFMKQKRGHIINISSVAGRKTFVGGGVYSATKAAVKVITESLRLELEPSFGIKTTLIEPGAVATELASVTTDREFVENNEFAVSKVLDPCDVAEAVCYALSQPQHVNIDTITVSPHEQNW